MKLNYHHIDFLFTVFQRKIEHNYSFPFCLLVLPQLDREEFHTALQHSIGAGAFGAQLDTTNQQCQGHIITTTKLTISYKIALLGND